MTDEAKRAAALQALAQQDGFTVDELLEAVGLEAVVPAICINPDCRYRDDLEPDGEGTCPECGDVMASALVLAEVI